MLSFLKKSRNIGLLCTFPFWIVVIEAFYISPKTYPFWSKSLAICGYSAVSFLAVCLLITPLSRIFPSVSLFKIFNRHKREIGLSVFFYAAFHVFSYFMKKWLKSGALPWDSLLKPYIVVAEIAFVILLLLALTSNDFSVRKLQWKNWKALHRFVYLAEVLIFLHMVLQGGLVLRWAFIIFLPLTIFQLIRVQKR